MDKEGRDTRPAVSAPVQQRGVITVDSSDDEARFTAARRSKDEAKSPSRLYVQSVVHTPERQAELRQQQAEARERDAMLREFVLSADCNRRWYGLTAKRMRLV